ncbi:MAG TPA: FixH family protein [Vicinamibacterales bacterium]|nr:FixH family protein [Vicinamibacterales bacterium]
MKRHWHWGTRIALVYALFASGTITMVVIAMRQPVDLVSADYYERSLAVDARTAALANVVALDGRFSIQPSSDGRTVEIRWPAEMAGAAGTVALYRPSDAADDRAIRMAPDATGRQTVALGGLRPGLWRVNVDWKFDGRLFAATTEVHVR